MVSSGLRYYQVALNWYVLAGHCTCYYVSIYDVFRENILNICCCSNICNDCCIRMCYCCCLRPKYLPQALQLEVNTSHDDIGKRMNNCDDSAQETSSVPQSPPTSTSNSEDVILVPVLTMGLNSIFNLQSDSVDLANLTTKRDTISECRNSPYTHSHNIESKANIDKADKIIYIVEIDDSNNEIDNEIELCQEQV